MTWPTKTDFVDGDVLTAAQVNNIGTNLNEADPTGITDGYVLTADGAGGMGWEAVIAGGMTAITSGSMTGLSTITLSSIPQTYKKLVLYLNDFRNNSNTYSVTYRINNNSGTVYQTAGWYALTSNLATAAAQTATPNLNSYALSNVHDAQASLSIDQYTEASYQTIEVSSVGISNAGGTNSIINRRTDMYYGTPAPVTRIDLLLLGGGWAFTQGTYTLYGVS